MLTGLRCICVSVEPKTLRGGAGWSQTAGFKLFAVRVLWSESATPPPLPVCDRT